MNYVDEIDERCVGCPFHVLAMADADMNASSCTKHSTWCCNISNCKNMK